MRVDWLQISVWKLFLFVFVSQRKYLAFFILTFSDFFLLICLLTQKFDCFGQALFASFAPKPPMNSADLTSHYKIFTIPFPPAVSSSSFLTLLSFRLHSFRSNWFFLPVSLLNLLFPPVWKFNPVSLTVWRKILIFLTLVTFFLQASSYCLRIISVFRHFERFLWIRLGSVVRMDCFFTLFFMSSSFLQVR